MRKASSASVAEKFLKNKEKIMLVWLMIIVGVIFLDQLTKWLTVINLEYIAPPAMPDTIPVIEDIFHFTYVRNEGAAFGMLKDQRWVFLIVSTVAIVAMSIYLWKNRHGSKLLNLGMAFIIGGGIGNMIDRTILGYVIDFLDFRIINFAVFNVADSFVCVGVGIFALAVILEEIETSKKEKAAKLAAAAEADEVIEDE